MGGFSEDHQKERDGARRWGFWLVGGVVYVVIKAAVRAVSCLYCGKNNFLCGSCDTVYYETHNRIEPNQCPADHPIRTRNLRLCPLKDGTLIITPSQA